MKHLVLFISFLIFYSTSLAQFYYEPGYIIDNENTKTECLIKYKDWEFTPQSFEYKPGINDDVQEVSIANVKEVNITGKAKYIRSSLKIDRSSSDLDNLSRVRHPEWNYETLFLKVLVEGKASLYYYGKNNFTRFFYSVGDSIEQLVYKEFIVVKDNLTGTSINANYRQQLFISVNCNKTESDYIHLEYDQKSLVKHFIDYNRCAGTEAHFYTKEEQKDNFNVKIAIGLDYSSLSVFDYISDSQDTDFGAEINPMAAVEAEYIFPFRKNKWSLVAESSFHSFKSEGICNTGTTTIKYGAIDVSMGVRHYLYLGKKKKQKIYFNGFLNSITTFNLNSEIVLPNTTSIREFKDHLNLSFGAGFNYKKISTELRYYTPQGVFSHQVFPTWGSDLRRISLIVGINIL